MTSFIEKNQTLFTRIIIGVAVLLALFLLVATIFKLKEYRYIGSGMEAKNTITVSGVGKIEKTPDTARVTFTIRNEQRDVKSAQENVSGKIDAIKKALVSAGVDEKYIKTDSYNSYPQYNYTRSICTAYSCPPQGSPTIRGYEVAHTVTVSIKNLESVETVLGILATNQVTDMQGPNFGFEDDVKVAREAREKAIEDAREEAEALAESLDVDLVRIVSFSENGAGMPQPFSVRNQAMDGKESAGSAPSIPVGSQNIESQVTIVYEIR